jgi:hypothetical protein
MNRYTLSLLVLGVATLSGCGLGMLQTAKTTPKGDLDFSLAIGYLHNEMTDVRGFAFTNVPLHLGLRYGLTDNLDLGAALFMGLGLMTDVKYNFLPPGNPLGISLQGGLAAAYDEMALATTIHLPARALVSYEIADGALTPYAGFSFGLYWIFGYGDNDQPDPGTNLASREGHGDGVIAASLGLEFFSRSCPGYFLRSPKISTACSCGRSAQNLASATAPAAEL